MSEARPPLRVTALDRAIAAVAPQRALRRVAARARLHALSQFFGAGGYSGARGTKRSLRNWWPGARDANADAVPDLPALRARSRDLYRNAPIATGAIKTVRTAVAGIGLRLQAQPDYEVLGITEEAAREWGRRAEAIHKVAAAQIDLTGYQHLDQLYGLVLGTELLSGDVLAIRRFREIPGHLLGTKIQIVEGDRIATPPDRAADPNVVAGVERDADGRIVAFHVRNRHDDTMPLPLRTGAAEEWTRVPAFMTEGPLVGQPAALLIMERERPDQMRGVVFLAPVIEILKQLERYSDSELAAAVISSFFTVFVKTEGATGLANAVDPDAADDGTQSSDNPKHDLELGTGAVVDLNPNESIEIANPMRPNAGFDPFVQAMLRQVGVALEIPFEILIKHFTASYSAARAAILEAWRFFRRRRHELVIQFAQPTYEWVITEAVARGLLVAPGFFDDPIRRMAWLQATWTGMAQGQIDPVKETNAAKMRIDLGASTYTEVTAELTGGDWERNHQRLKRETDMRRRDGLDREAVAERIATEPTTPQPPAETIPAEAPDDGEEKPEEA